MIPIIWNSDEWVKANLEMEWYNYDDKRWANVVLVREEVRDDYKNANEGFVIQEEDVLAYLVWIPRYKYKLFNVEGESIEPITINIDFEADNTPKSVGAEDGQYLTHPAFTVGNNELNGIWVGKFETTGTATVPTIKPGITSLRSQNIYNQFLTSQRFNVTSLYGFIENIEARMMNNFEWGAVTYLSHSKYGKNEEVWMNPSGSYITGCAGNAPTSGESPGCNNHYTSLNGQEASTTGNVYGIYDTAGGAWEFVLGGMYNSLETAIILGSSGFNQEGLSNYSISKYVNKYGYGTTSNNEAAYNRRFLGDATSETRGWYDDYQIFVNSSNPWFTRGGRAANGSSAGQFGFYYHLGNPVADRSFRVVLSSQ